MKIYGVFEYQEDRNKNVVIEESYTPIEFFRIKEDAYKCAFKNSVEYLTEDKDLLVHLTDYLKERDISCNENENENENENCSWCLKMEIIEDFYRLEDIVETVDEKPLTYIIKKFSV